jgi:hypothetical protein
MGGVIFLAVFILAAVGIAAAVVYGTRSETNQWPALGTSRGYGMMWWRRRWPNWRNSSVPAAEEAVGPHYDLRTVDHKLEELASRHHTPSRQGRSWMDEPGAFERAGLVDEIDLGEAPTSHPHGRDELSHVSRQ